VQEYDHDHDHDAQPQRHETRQMVGLVLLFTLIAAGGWWAWGKITQADDNSKSEASATTSAPSAQAEADIEAAYRAFIAMIGRVVQAPDPDDPELPMRATGVALDGLRSSIARSLAEGTIIRPGPATSATVLSIEVSGDTATLRACFIDESTAYVAVTGAVVEPTTIVTIVDTVELEREGDTWLVSRRETPGPDERWNGVNTCGS
jgi:hypothetical protein